MNAIKRWWGRASGRSRALGLGVGGCALACVAFWSIGFIGLAIQGPQPTRTPAPPTLPRTIAPSATPAPTHTPRPSQTPRPSATATVPTPTRTTSPTRTRPVQTFEVVEFRSPVPVNGDARVVIQTTAGATCQISYRTPAGTLSEAQGLETQTAGADGRCTWQWQIGRGTNPGQGSVSISVAGYSQTLPIVIE